MAINVVLDIDDLLACTTPYSDSNRTFFLKKGHIVTAVRTHYLFHGAVELIRLLASLPDVKLSFFSSGAEERNAPFVAEIMKLAFPDSKPSQEVRVFSRCHLDSTNKKDLTCCLEKGDLLKNAILVDDLARFNINNGQAFLHTQPNTLDDVEGYRGYGASGFKMLPLALKETQPPSVDSVKMGKEILLIRSDSGTEIIYFHQVSKEVKRLLLTPEMHSALINKLAELNAGCIHNEEVIQCVQQLVEENGGFYKEMCKSPNRLYFVAGVVTEALELARSQQCTLKGAVDELQKREVWPLSEIERYYHIGLKSLQYYNPNLNFLTPRCFERICVGKLTAEEEQELEKARKNERNECAIM